MVGDPQTGKSQLIEAFKEIKGVNGVHLMGHKKEELIAEIIKESKIS